MSRTSTAHALPAEGKVPKTDIKVCAAAVHEQIGALPEVQLKSGWILAPATTTPLAALS